VAATVKEDMGTKVGTVKEDTAIRVDMVKETRADMGKEHLNNNSLMTAVRPGSRRSDSITQTPCSWATSATSAKRKSVTC
jgi:hypothetical protein